MCLGKCTYMICTLPQNEHLTLFVYKSAPYSAMTLTYIPSVCTRLGVMFILKPKHSKRCFTNSQVNEGDEQETS